MELLTPIVRCAEVTLLAMLLVLALIDAAPGADGGRGSLLYENHCTGCHESEVHIRDRREVRSDEDLRRWIVRWQAELGLGWTQAEVEDVRRFLGERYYGLNYNP